MTDPDSHGPPRRRDVLFSGIRELCETATRLTGVDGAAIAVFGSAGDNRELIYATDATAAHLDDLQFTLGEGPCIGAFATQSSVLVGSLDTDEATTHWPVFRSEVLLMGVGAVFAVPVTVDDFAVGVLELYRRRPGDLTRDEAQSAQVSARLAAATIRRNADDVARSPRDVEHIVVDEPGGPFARDDVHVATGIIAVQLDIGTEEALDRLRAVAFSQGRPIGSVAGEIVARTATFTDIASRDIEGRDIESRDDQ
ncbi:GAF and ANTAR domain-containing protein [Williamsia deligens]|uniref:GAF and ANTAR domain-containing protein n=1 Tax=Williamsia deligens TaxID=321325 RepID=A0ABW3G8N2_9NOCA|nr:GAF and ANTAR domain-containing protein [Williamsia deligens]MCP2192799.1 ANTAR domain-containing protein [Williamsia deligens]